MIYLHLKLIFTEIRKKRNKIFKAMKLQFLLIFSILTFFSCKEATKTAENKTDSIQGSVDIKDFEIADIPGSSYKRAYKKDENGHIIEEGFFLDGKMTGAWFNYYPDGRVVAIRSYIDGKVDGTFITIDDRGRVMLQAMYQNNYLNGMFTEYKNGSRKMKETFYKDGKKEGIQREYFELGPPQKEIEYKNDVIDGKMKFFNDKSELVAEYEYKDGKKISGGIVKGADSTGVDMSVPKAGK